MTVWKRKVHFPAIAQQDRVRDSPSSYAFAFAIGIRLNHIQFIVQPDHRPRLNLLRQKIFNNLCRLGQGVAKHHLPQWV